MKMTKTMKNPSNLVQVHTSLPPGIEEAPLFTLLLSVKLMRWTTRHNDVSDDIIVRVVWWGEETSGAIFRPRLGHLVGHKQITRTLARYPVRVPMAQFTTYLSDMSNLTFEVQDNQSNKNIGKAQMDFLVALKLDNCIEKIIAIMDDAGNKVGELTVKLSLEPVKASNIDTIIAPPTGLGKRLPLNKTVDIGQLRSINSGDWPKHDDVSREHAVDDDLLVIGQEADLHSKTVPFDGTTLDMIGSVVERGRRLRQSMACWQADDDVTAVVSDNVFPGLSHVVEIDETSTVQLRSSRELLGEVFASTDEETGVDLRTVDLVIGGRRTNHHLDREDSVEGSDWARSGGLSDDDDPVKEESLLEELFFKRPESNSDTDLDTTSSEEDPKPHVTKETSIKTTILQTNGQQARTTQQNPQIEPRKQTLLRQTKKGNLRRGSRSTSASSSIQGTGDGSFIGKSRDKKRSGRARRRPRSVSSSADSDVRDSWDRIGSGADQFNAEISPFRATLLRLVTFARFHISHLKLEESSKNRRQASVSRSRSRSASPAGSVNGRPPVQTTKRQPKSYILECTIPATTESRVRFEVPFEGGHKSKQNVISLDKSHSCTVDFSGLQLEQWWRGAIKIKVFVVYADNAITGQKAVTRHLGNCRFRLKNLILADSLLIEERLKVMAPSPKSLQSTTPPRVIGCLAMTSELGSERPEFIRQLAQTQLSEMRQDVVTNKEVVVEPSCAPVVHEAAIDVKTQPKPTYEKPRVERRHVAPPTPSSSLYDKEATTLHTVLIVPEGRNIDLHCNSISARSLPMSHRSIPVNPLATAGALSMRDTATRNVYLVARLFCHSDAQHSSVAWGCLDSPKFGFVTRAPCLLTPGLLERLRDNFSVVEVWDKKTGAEKDHLIGLVKLPLHQFFLSFRNPQITSALLRAQYPVLSVDNWLPIVDPRSGQQLGQLHVLLGMGSSEQVAELETVKMSANPLLISRERADLWKDNASSNKVAAGFEEEMVEHILDIGVESLRDFCPISDEGISWGDCDCFVQYFFPTQQHSPNTDETSSMIGYRTSSTLLVPGTSFHEVTRHRIILPINDPLQRELLAACASSGHEGSGGIPVELWVRQYTPNVRDRVVCRGLVPLNRLCSLVSLHKAGLGEASQQVIQIQLSRLEGKRDNGRLDLTLNYRTRRVHQAISSKSSVNNTGRGVSSNTMTGSNHVTLIVELATACGLQSAARLWSQHSVGMEYPSIAGVNVYAQFWLSWATSPEAADIEDRCPIDGTVRRTRTVARSFTPDLAYTAELVLPLVTGSGTSVSLAERLQSTVLHVELFHQVPITARDLTSGAVEILNQNTNGGRRVFDLGGGTDVLLAQCSLSLDKLMLHRTASLPLSWLPLTPPSQLETWSRDSSVQPVVGGLEVGLRLADGKEDRRRVLRVATELGYLLPWATGVEDEEEMIEWLEEDEFGCRYKHINITLDSVAFPILPCRPVVDLEVAPSTRVFLRYRLYNRPVVSTKPTSFVADEDGIARIKLDRRDDHCFRVSPALLLYLRETKLEVQLWCSQEKSTLQTASNRLLGSGLLPLSDLVLPSRRQHRLHTVIPLFKRLSADMSGASVSFTVTICSALEPLSEYSSGLDTDEDLDIGASGDKPSTSQDRKGSGRGHKKSAQHHLRCLAAEHSFPVHVIIEQAMHLGAISVNERENTPPNAYVTFTSAESSHALRTQVVTESQSPKWNYERDTRLAKQLLTQDSKLLVFKVWHRPGEQESSLEDRMIGFATMDLSPLLLARMHRLEGWYNIVDLRGQCQGQIKLGLSGIPTSISGASRQILLGQEHHLDSMSETAIPLEEHQAYLLQWKNRLRQLTTGIHGNGEARNGAFDQPAVSSDYIVPARTDSSNIQTIPISTDEGQDTSRSKLFSQLHNNMSELDMINQRLRERLSLEDVVMDSVVPVVEEEFYPSEEEEALPIRALNDVSGLDIGWNASAWNTPQDNFVAQTSNFYMRPPECSIPMIPVGPSPPCFRGLHDYHLKSSSYHSDEKGESSDLQRQKKKKKDKKKKKQSSSSTSSKRSSSTSSSSDSSSSSSSSESTEKKRRKKKKKPKSSNSSATKTPVLHKSKDSTTVDKGKENTSLSFSDRREVTNISQPKKTDSVEIMGSSIDHENDGVIDLLRQPIKSQQEQYSAEYSNSSIDHENDRAVDFSRQPIISQQGQHSHEYSRRSIDHETDGAIDFSRKPMISQQGQHSVEYSRNSIDHEKGGVTDVSRQPMRSQQGQYSTEYSRSSNYHQQDGVTDFSLQPMRSQQGQHSTEYSRSSNYHQQDGVTDFSLQPMRSQQGQHSTEYSRSSIDYEKDGVIDFSKEPMISQHGQHSTEFSRSSIDHEKDRVTDLSRQPMLLLEDQNSLGSDHSQEKDEIRNPGSIQHITSNGTVQLPNFFVPNKDFQERMRALRLGQLSPQTTNEEEWLDSGRREAKLVATRELVARLRRPNPANVGMDHGERSGAGQVPSAEERARIARIFTMKF